MKIFRLIVLLFCCLVTTVAVAQSRDELLIRKLLSDQETAWNQGNLHAFMKGYWENDSLLFIGRKGPVYGYRETLSNYLKSYPDTAHMGHFTSTVIKVSPLGKDYYMVIGKWELKRSAGNVGGYYSLLFRKIRGQWVIIQDHTS